MESDVIQKWQYSETSKKTLQFPRHYYSPKNPYFTIQAFQRNTSVGKCELEFIRRLDSIPLGLDKDSKLLHAQSNLGHNPIYFHRSKPRWTP